MDLCFLGAGPSFGVAALGVAKMKEAIGARAVTLQFEEFNHLQDTALSANDALIVVAPGDAVVDVVEGILTLATQRGAWTLLLADDRSAPLHRLASRAIILPVCDEMLSPFVTIPTVQALAWPLYQVRARPDLWP